MMFYLVRILEDYTFVNVTQVTLFPPLANLLTFHSLCSLLFSLSFLFIFSKCPPYCFSMSPIFCPLPLNASLCSGTTEYPKPTKEANLWWSGLRA